MTRYTERGGSLPRTTHKYVAKRFGPLTLLLSRHNLSRAPDYDSLSVVLLRQIPFFVLSAATQDREPRGDDRIDDKKCWMRGWLGPWG